MDIVKEKIKQAGPLLDEMGIDLWLIAVRETSMQSDPVMPLVVGLEATWQSFFLYTRTGEAYALIGNYDQADYVASGRFTEVIPYTEGVEADLRKLIGRLDPKSIAINFSPDNPAADGLTHGMYLKLCDYLKGTPYADRLVSAAEFCGKLRARKTKAEIERLEAAALMAADVWTTVVDRFEIGMTEIEVAQIIETEIADRGAAISFETIANAGDKTAPGHGSPTKAKLESGDLLHVDFGILLDGYCSDIQRLLYFRRPNETGAPPELVEAYAMVSEIITNASRKIVPGIKGYEVDAQARATLRDNGYEEYQHALGHQLGREVHDGGALIGPKWPRYGGSPEIPLEAGNAFTLELGIELPGIGYAGQEEDIVIEATGGRFLSPRQTELDLK